MEDVRRAKPDLVTLDLNLPDLDGLEVCKLLREFSDAFIVMLTARADELDKLTGLDNGADDYISKPFSPRELQSRINALFRRRPSPPPWTPPPAASSSAPPKSSKASCPRRTSGWRATTSPASSAPPAAWAGTSTTGTGPRTACT